MLKIYKAGVVLRPFRTAGLLLLALLILSGTGITVAQTPPTTPAPKAGLAVSPPTFELSANPGDTLTNSLRVDNVVDTPLEVSVEARNFTALGEEGGIDLSTEEGQYSLASWVSVTPEKVTIPARSSQVFEYKIAVPSNASPGGRFGSIIFKTTLQEVGGQSGVAIGQEVGALVFLKIAGQVNEKASIAGFDSKNTLHDHGPVQFELRLKNEGNIQFKPKGTVTITNFFGDKVATVPIDEQNVLPGAIRKMTADWKSGWLFGKYTATVSVVYGENDTVLTTSTTFWGFPYKLVGILLLALIALGALLYPRRKRLAKAFKVLFGKE